MREDMAKKSKDQIPWGRVPSYIVLNKSEAFVNSCLNNKRGPVNQHLYLPSVVYTDITYTSYEIPPSALPDLSSIALMKNPTYDEMSDEIRGVINFDC